MELSFEQQSLAFLLSVLLGTLLGAVYGVLKFLRVAFSVGKLGTFALDFLFMIFSAFMLFLFSLGYIRGYVRLYAIFGAVLGMALQRNTVGRLLTRIYLPIIRAIRKIFAIFFEKIKKIVKSLLNFAGNILYNKSGKVNQIITKSDN